MLWLLLHTIILKIIKQIIVIQKKTTILLLGKAGAGKTTLCRILSNKGFEEKKSKPTTNENTYNCHPDFEIIDQSGNKQAAKDREKKKKEIFNDPYFESKNIVFLYVFNAEEFDKNKEDILNAIESEYEEVEEKHKNIKFKALGTRKDLIKETYKKIETEIYDKINCEVEIFDMTSSPKELIENFIKE